MKPSTALVLIITLAIGYLVGNFTAIRQIDKTPYSFQDGGAGIVEAYGTFAVRDENGQLLSGNGDPTGVNGHTVDLICDQTLMTCNESQAWLGSNVGSGSNHITIGNSKTYKIDRWADDTISTKPLSVDQCTDEIVTIDRVGKKVVILNTLSKASGLCASLSSKPVILTIQ